MKLRIAGRNEVYLGLAFSFKISRGNMMIMRKIIGKLEFLQKVGSKIRHKPSTQSSSHHSATEKILIT